MESTLSKDISELLYHYDCVIVPALGGFVTNYRPARLDKDLNLFHPPSKEVSFNRQLDKNDGILAHAMAEASSISHEEANSLIRTEVESYFSALDNGGRVVFKKVGILYLDKEKNVQFSPDESVNYLLDSYGLKKVHAVPVERTEEVVIEEPVIISAPPPIPKIETREKPVLSSPKVVPAPRTVPEEPEVVEEKESTPIVAMETKSSKSKGWYWAAALIPLLVILGISYQSGLLTSGATSVGELDPFKDSVRSTYEERTASLEIATESMPPLATDTTAEWFTQKGTSSPTAGENSAPVTATKEEPLAEIEPLASPAEAVNTYVAPSEIVQQEFHIVAGCFSIEANAQKMVDRLRTKGFQSHILDQRKGLYRVTYGSYATRAEALEDLSAIKQENDDAAWLLRKR